ncbi:MAG: tRNA pseudouridine(55) synthase TruB [Gammaproteobacteria bacterium]
MNRRHRGAAQEIHGILLLDKPVDRTSNEALQEVKKLFRARKAGHTGSLDRMASGMLPLCFGEATKFSAYLLDADKRYSATCKLGVRTATGDAAGAVLSVQRVPEVGSGQIERALQAFRGEIEQTPPMFSAIKHEGQRLYKLAYQGIEVDRRPRTIVIHELELVGAAADEFQIRVVCSKGTYIRTLADDIGQRLGCGAHVLKLRRTGVGPFRESEMVILAQAEEAARTGSEATAQILLGADAMLRGHPEVVLGDTVAYYLCQGQPVIVPHAPTDGLVRMYDEAKRFLGVGEILDDGRVAPRRLVNPS